MATPGELNEKKTNLNVSHQHFLFSPVFFLYTWQAYIENQKGSPLYWNVVSEKGPCRASNGPDSGPRRDHTRGVPEKWPSSSAARGIPDKFAIFSSRGSGFFWRAGSDAIDIYVCELRSRWWCQKFVRSSPCKDIARLQWCLMFY